MIVCFGSHGNITFILHSRVYVMIKCIGNEANVYMLKSDEIRSYDNWSRIMIVYPSFTCEDTCLSAGFKGSSL